MAEYKTDKVLVAAIDFGTTYSGYAFSFRDEYQKDPAKVIANTNWMSGTKSLLSLKTPTCLLLKPDKSFHSFGYQAEEHYSELASEDLHQDWYYFRRFKMMLHGAEMLNRDVELSDETGKKIPAKTVFAHGIRYLKEHLLQLLDTRGLLESIVADEYIHWVLTIPAIWNDSAKQFMREAAQEAGIPSKNLTLALEPEAAALYCKVLPIEKLSDSGTSSLAVFRPGTRYMILDLGGGTVDITVQEVLKNNTLKELHKASGGAWGGIYVDAAFLQLVIQLVGNPVIQKFKKDNPADDLELVREFEVKKRSIGKSAHDQVTFRMPVTLSDTFEEEYSESIKEVLMQGKYAQKMQWRGDKWRVHKSIVHQLFQNCQESIIDHIRDLLTLPESEGVNTLLMVGGFSECKLIQDAVKEAFPDKRLIIPEEPGLAVVKGAVLFGHNPKTIISRMAKFTYGVKINRDAELDDPLDKQFDVKGQKKCKDCFSKHVTINTSVLVDQPLEAKMYKPLRPEDTAVIIQIYTSTDRNPRYTTEPTCTCVGELVINLSRSTTSDHDDREIKVNMTFGGTELIVEAIETKSNTPCIAKFDFLKHHG